MKYSLLYSVQSLTHDWQQICDDIIHDGITIRRGPGIGSCLSPVSRESCCLSKHLGDRDLTSKLVTKTKAEPGSRCRKTDRFVVIAVK